MNGGHDLGGKQGLGPIKPEPEAQEPVFHEEWERRVFALTMAAGMLGRWNIDQSRHARERQHPADYLNNSYYENWLAGVEKLLAETGLLDADANNHDLRIPNPADADKILASGGPTTMDSHKPPAFRIGASVRLKKIHTAAHTRAPSYAQGSIGAVVTHHGCHVFPDSNAQGNHLGEHLYSVRFSAQELWGRDAENFDVLIDLWEPYLQALDET
ncbi:MAG: nitrile hydratase subunit beta [Pseudomonadales bacterium]|nr:nitrile hydratase subunit beta [Pseudomonadales bacterium]